jgi:hypothetical protein
MMTNGIAKKTEDPSVNPLRLKDDWDRLLPEVDPEDLPPYHRHRILQYLATQSIAYRRSHLRRMRT